MAKKYTIVIDETQRLAMLQAFMTLGHVISTDEDIDILESMLRQIEIDETDDPGTIHDFTL